MPRAFRAWKEIISLWNQNVILWDLMVKTREKVRIENFSRASPLVRVFKSGHFCVLDDIFRFGLLLSNVCQFGGGGGNADGDRLCALLELLRDSHSETDQETERDPGPLGQTESPAGPRGLKGFTARWDHVLRRDGSQVRPLELRFVFSFSLIGSLCLFPSQNLVLKWFFHQIWNSMTPDYQRQRENFLIARSSQWDQSEPQTRIQI